MKKIWQYIKRLFSPRTTTVTINLSTTNIEADSIVLRNGERSVKIEVNAEGRLLIHGDLATTGNMAYYYPDKEIKR